MRLELTRREDVSRLREVVSPILAVAATAVFGAVLFAALGKPPLQALYAYFIEPLSDIWSLHELALKAAPLILIAVGLSVAFRSSNWNIGAEGQLIAGAIAAGAIPVLWPSASGAWVLPAMLGLAMVGGRFGPPFRRCSRPGSVRTKSSCR